MDGVMDDDVAAVKGHLDAQDVGLAGVDAALGLCGIHVAAGALVALEGVLALLGGGAVGRELLGRAEAGVGLALVPEALGGLLVEVEALGLGVGAKVAADLGTLVPVKAQPAHGAQDDLGVLVGGAGGVGVIDAQDERTAVGAGKGPVVDGGAGAADVPVPVGTAQSCAHGLVCHGVSSRWVPIFIRFTSIARREVRGGSRRRGDRQLMPAHFSPQIWRFGTPSARNAMLSHGNGVLAGFCAKPQHSWREPPRPRPQRAKPQKPWRLLPPCR